MKRFIAFLLLSFTAATVHAGSFGGPPPFKNDSPLVTGVDGSYQAIARSPNVTGVFRFAYSNGQQTSSNSANTWVFWIDGRPQRGVTTAAINNSDLSGVLDSGSGSLGTNSNGTFSLPAVLYNQQAQAAGYFNGKMNLMDASCRFSGKGEINPAPPQTNQLVIITTNIFGTSINTILLTNGTGTGVTNPFKFRGVRTSLTSASSTSTTTN